MAITAQSRKLTQSEFLAIDEAVKAELGARPEVSGAGLSFLGYRTINNAEFDRRMKAFDAQDEARRQWDRAYKARFREIAAALSAPVAAPALARAA